MLFIIFYFIAIVGLVSCKPRISFLGSSVTAQKTGYVPALKTLYSDHFEFEGHGFGGVPINLCKFDVAFQNKPDIIMFDWSILSGHPLEEKYIRASIARSKFENSIPVYLVFPRLDDGNRAMINLIHDLSSQLNFSVIDLSKTFSRDELQNVILRDNQHTTDLGGIKYAEIIFKFLQSTELKVPIIGDLSVERSMVFPKTQVIDGVAFDSAKISLNGVLYGFFHLIGPHSNYIDVYEDRQYKYRNIFFDDSCYYVRPTFWDHTLRSFSGTIEIQVLNEDFDRKMAHRNVDWSAVKTKFHITDICYSGDLIKVIVDEKEIFAK